jgi:hypothetical protein
MIQVSGQKVESGAILGYHTGEITLAEGVTPSQFEGFIAEEYLPAMEKHFPGMKMFLLKGERGEHINDYGLLFYFENIEVRNEWIPEPGKLSEKAKKALEKMQDLEDKFNKMINQNTTYTDWLVL